MTRSTSTTRARPKRRTPQRRTLADQLRDAIERSGLTDHAIAQAAQLDPSAVGRFMRAERSWTLDTAEHVAAVLGLGIGPAAGVARGSGQAPGKPARRDVDRRPRRSDPAQVDVAHEQDVTEGVGDEEALDLPPIAGGFGEPDLTGV